MTFFQLNHLLENRRGNQNNHDKLALRFPSPETLYPYHPMDKAAENQCTTYCSQLYCLQDICLTSVMADTHFPTSRPVSVPVADIDRHIQFKAK